VARLGTQPDSVRTSNQRIPAAVALPLGFAGLLLIGCVAAANLSWFGARGVLVGSVALVAVLTFAAEPLVGVPLAVIGWLTVAAFSRPPYADLHAGHTARPALILAATACAASVAGGWARRSRPASDEPTQPWRATLDIVNGAAESKLSSNRLMPADRLTRGVGRRRSAAGFALGVLALPALTVILRLADQHLALVDDVLIYLVAVVAVAVVGGLWPAVFAAVAATLLLNWYFTPPVHTWTVDSPQNILALLLFVAVGVTVSSVVHLAARRDALARERAADAAELSHLAGTVLAGDDHPSAVLAHLYRSRGVAAQLEERRNGRWIAVAAGGEPTGAQRSIRCGPDLRLTLFGTSSRVSDAVVEGFAAQAVAALERQRLRIQAGQAEALAEGNRMRTALLTAVSHDLRTPLASVKAAVSTLRQTDVRWDPGDEAALLATIEEGADRLDALIGNLLDMSRIQTGSVRPFLRPTSLEEVVPLIARTGPLRLDIPDGLPLLQTDPGLLERALDNIAANATRYSPDARPPELVAREAEGIVVVEVIDHGPGVPAEAYGRMFEPFQQLDDHHPGSGVGLGLAVAKGFIDLLGGRVSAGPTPGGGLTMRIELPAGMASRRSTALR
jgi:two-component system, OmpR family, sensor histidine kinase KdpD